MHIFSYAKKRHVSNFRFLFLFYFHRPFVFTFIKVQTFYEYNNKCIQQHFKPFHVVVSCQNLPQFLQICYSFMKYQYISDISSNKFGLVLLSRLIFLYGKQHNLTNSFKRFCCNILRVCTQNFKEKIRYSKRHIESHKMQIQFVSYVRCSS